MGQDVKIIPHPELLDILFRYKSSVSLIFNDVLGIHGLDHISMTSITKKHEILILSSTPSMEFTLFNNNLWKFDRTYQPDWFQRCQKDEWPTLYHRSRFEELFYVKQFKTHYSLGYSFSQLIDSKYFICSMGFKLGKKEDILIHYEKDLLKIAKYCSKRLFPYLAEYD